MSINKELYRPLKDGSKFDKYFENSSCNATYIGEGNTTATLEYMRDEAYKYASQTKKIAKLLKGATLKETVDNIYNFLYHHVQYGIDGLDQELKSPNCVWSSKECDCKSYSTFASTILLNLGIEHTFRKVKQPLLNPKNWSHVYVVLNDGSVIDPTIKNNQEVDYSKKYDLKMKLRHYSLNGAVSTETHPEQHIADGFLNKVIPLLSRFKVSEEVLNQIEAKVIASYERYGSESKFRFRFFKGNNLLIDNEVIQLYPNGLGAGLNGIFDGIDFNYNNGDGSFQTNDGDGEFDLGTTLGNFQDTNGNFTAGAVEAGLDLATGGLASIVSGLIGFDIGEAVDLILSGHWDCIGGSTWKPEALKERTTLYNSWYTHQTAKIGKATSYKEVETLINELTRVTHAFRDGWVIYKKSKDWNSCSSKVLKGLVDLGGSALSQSEQFINSLSNKINIKKVSESNVLQPTGTSVFWDEIGLGDMEGYRIGSYPIYKVIPTQQQISNGTDNGGNPKEKTSIIPKVLGGMTAAAALFFVVKAKSEPTQ